MSNAIEAAGLTRRFGSLTAVDSLSFEVADGDLVGLIGPNGCGKTSTVRLATGVLKADAGQVRVWGLDPDVDGEKVRASCGVLTESAAFYGPMSALENLRYFARLTGADEKRAPQLLERLGLGDAMDRAAGTFSTGMKRRLGLARALLHRPKVLFLDEPTNGLDPQGIRDVLALIRTVHAEEGTTMVLCSHLLEQLETVCRRYLVMKRGRLVAKGTLDELARQSGAGGMTLEIETTYRPVDGTIAGHRAEPISEQKLSVSVPGREAAPAIIRAVSQQAEVFGAKLSTPSLSDIYFRLTEASDAR